MASIYEPVEVIVPGQSGDEVVELSEYLMRVELPVQLEPLISGLFKRKVIQQHELHNYIIPNRTDGMYSHFVITEDGEVPLIEYCFLTADQYHALFNQVLWPFNITCIYEVDLMTFINSLEAKKSRQRTM